MNNPGGGNTAENYSYRKWQQTLRQLEAAEKRLQRMQEQRDKLLAACKAAADFLDFSEPNGRRDALYLRLKAAIREAKEET